MTTPQFDSCQVRPAKRTLARPGPKSGLGWKGLVFGVVCHDNCPYRTNEIKDLILRLHTKMSLCAN